MKGLRVRHLASGRINCLIPGAAIANTAPNAARISSLQQTPRLRDSQPRPVSHLRLCERPFSQHAALQKRKAKRGAEEEGDEPAAAPEQHEEEEESTSKHPKPDVNEPLNFADVESRWANLEEYHRDLIKKLRSGGRFNPDVIGALPVQPDRKQPATFPLRELAQVVPRSGRSISLLVHEKEYIKPIVAAIQASPDFNQQPQPDPDNELELVLRVELEKKEDMIVRLKGMTQAWREKARAAKTRREKVHAKWAKDKAIVPDLKRTADKELQKMQDKLLASIAKLEEQTIKQLNSSGA